MPISSKLPLKKKRNTVHNLITYLLFSQIKMGEGVDLTCLRLRLPIFKCNFYLTHVPHLFSCLFVCLPLCLFCVFCFDVCVSVWLYASLSVCRYFMDSLSLVFHHYCEIYCEITNWLHKNKMNLKPAHVSSVDINSQSVCI